MFIFCIYWTIFIAISFLAQTTICCTFKRNINIDNKSCGYGRATKALEENVHKKKYHLERSVR